MDLGTLKESPFAPDNPRGVRISQILEKISNESIQEIFSGKNVPPPQIKDAKIALPKISKSEFRQNYIKTSYKNGITKSLILGATKLTECLEVGYILGFGENLMKANHDTPQPSLRGYQEMNEAIQNTITEMNQGIVSTMKTRIIASRY